MITPCPGWRLPFRVNAIDFLARYKYYLETSQVSLMVFHFDFDCRKSIVADEFLWSYFERRVGPRVFFIDLTPVDNESTYETEAEFLKQAERIVGEKIFDLAECLCLPPCDSLVFVDPNDFSQTLQVPITSQVGVEDIVPLIDPVFYNFNKSNAFENEALQRLRENLDALSNCSEESSLRGYELSYLRALARPALESLKTLRVQSTVPGEALIIEWEKELDYLAKFPLHTGRAEAFLKKRGGQVRIMGQFYNHCRFREGILQVLDRAIVVQCALALRIKEAPVFPMSTLKTTLLRHAAINEIRQLPQATEGIARLRDVFSSFGDGSDE